MLFSNRHDPHEFVGEMANYDDEAYGDEEEYAEDEEYEEEYEEEDGDEPAAKPKKDWVRSALFGTAAVMALGGVGYWAATTFAPETVNELVNNLPFVSKGSDEFAQETPNGETPPPAAPAGGEVAPPPTDVTATGGDVAAVPPPPVAAPMKPVKPKPMAPAKPKPQPKPVAKPQPKPMMAAKPKPAVKKWQRPAVSKWAAKKRWTRYAAKPRWTRPVRTAYASPYARARYSRSYYGYRAAYKPRYAYNSYKRTNARYGRRYAAAARPAAAAYRNTGRYAVQVGSFANAENASALVTQLRAQGMAAYMSGGGRAVSTGSGYMVRSVSVRQPANAKRLLAQYRAAGYPAALIPTGNGFQAVSVGVYGSQGRAQSIVNRLNAAGLYGTMQYTQGATTYRGGGLARVYIGSYGSRTQAAAKMRQLQGQGIPASVTTR